MSSFRTDAVPAGVVERAAAGDRQAHGQLYEAYAAAVFTLARRMTGRPAWADDVLQETFVEVLDKLGDLRDHSAVGGWIRSIAVSKALMQLRASRWLEPLDAVALPAAPAESPELDLEAMLDRLPPLPRTVVWLHDVEGYTHGEIGRLLGRTSSFSKSQLARAYRRLRTALADDAEAEEEPCIRLSNS